MDKQRKYVVCHTCLDDLGELSVHNIGVYSDMASAKAKMDEYFAEILEDGHYSYDEGDSIFKDDSLCEARYQDELGLNQVKIIDLDNVWIW